MAKDFVLGVDLQIQQVLGLAQVRQELSKVAGTATGPAAGPVQAAKGVGQLTQSITAAAQANASLTQSTSQASAGLSTYATRTAAAGAATGKTAAAMTTSGKAAKNFGDQIFLAGKRYAAFVAATAVAFKGVQGIRDATSFVLEFESAMTRLDQIMDAGSARIGQLEQQFLRLSQATGTSATEIAENARILAQAGFQGAELDEALKQIAKVPLLPAFESSTQATTGLIAIMRQFKDEGKSTAEGQVPLVGLRRPQRGGQQLLGHLAGHHRGGQARRRRVRRIRRLAGRLHPPVRHHQADHAVERLDHRPGDQDHQQPGVPPGDAAVPAGQPCPGRRRADRQVRRLRAGPASGGQRNSHSRLRGLPQPSSSGPAFGENPTTTAACGRPQGNSDLQKERAPVQELALRVRNLLRDEPDTKLDNPRLNELAREVFGTAAGNARDAYDAAEAGMNLYLSELPIDFDAAAATVQKANGPHRGPYPAQSAIVNPQSAIE